MFVKEVKADFDGHQIAVRNSWGPALSFKSLNTELRLYIDGKVVDSNTELFSITRKSAYLRGNIEISGQFHIVEVYVRALIRTKIKICVDGKKIAGDLL